MLNDTLELIKRSAAIPTLPQVAVRFLELTQSPDFTHDQLVEVLSTDPGMAGEILRLANSALFGMSRKVTSLRYALVLLGVKRVRSLVLGRYMIDKIAQHTPPLVDTAYYWRRSLATGVLAAQFAAHICPQQRDEAFLAGLFADVGVMILAEAVEEDYRAAAAAYAPLTGRNFLKVERECVDVVHSEVSAVLLEYWQLPESIVNAVRYHHEVLPPADVPAGHALLARLVNGSSVISRLLCQVPDDHELIRDVCRAAMNLIGLSREVFRDVLGSLAADIAELAELLRIDIIPVRTYDEIAHSLDEPAGESRPATAVAEDRI